MADWSPRSKVTYGLACFFHVVAIIWLILFDLQVYFPDLPLLARLFPDPSLPPFFILSDGQQEQCIWHWRTKKDSFPAGLSAVILLWLSVFYCSYFFIRPFVRCTPYDDSMVFFMFQAFYLFLWFLLLFMMAIVAVMIHDGISMWTLECHRKCHQIEQASTAVKPMSEVECHSSQVVPTVVVIAVESVLLILNGVLHGITFRMNEE